MVTPKSSILVLSAIYIFSTCTAAFEWHDCSSKTAGLKSVEDVSLKPEPVPAGDTATFTIKGKSGISFASGKVQLSVYYLGLRVYSTSKSLQEPIRAGDFTTSFSRNFPAYTPPGSYTLRIGIVPDDREQFLCLDVKFKVTWGKGAQQLIA